MAYKFIKTIDPENPFETTNIEMEIEYNDINVTELMREFARFLVACGYSPSLIEELIEDNINEEA